MVSLIFQKNNGIILGISAPASKMGRIKKKNVPLIFDLTHFKGYGRNQKNNIIGFLENLRHHIFLLRLCEL